MNFQELSYSISPFIAVVWTVSCGHADAAGIVVPIYYLLKME